MIRVHVICEGQTEEFFVNELLRSHFIAKDILLNPALIGKPGHKGGNIRFERLLTDIRARLLGDTSAYCTTFFDFYGLPGNFPGKSESLGHNSHAIKAKCVIRAFSDKIEQILGKDPVRRFIPYVQMYEFEGLLFSDVQSLAIGINRPDLYGRFERVRAVFNSPEEINDNPESAPSKRVMKFYPGYEKPIHGALAALEMGLEVIREQCPLFNDWLTNLENLKAE